MVNNTLTIFQAYFSTLCSEFLSFFPISGNYVFLYLL